MSQRKGFMHSIEGLFAATIIFFYAIQLFQGMSVEKIDWVDASSKQEMQEFLIAAKNSDLADMVFYGDFSNFIYVTRHFLGESRGYSLKIDNLPKHIFEVGMLTETIVTVEATINSSDCLVPTGHSCYESTFKGIDYVLADDDSEVPDKEKYNMMYFDFDSSGTYEASEGPFVETNVLFIGGAYWSIGNIHNNSGNVSFWDAESLAHTKQHVRDFRINERQTNISIRGTLFSENLLVFDAIIIPAEITDITAYESTISAYVTQGGGVVRLKNITAQADINNAEKNIFAISWVNYDVRGIGSEGILTNVSASERIYAAGKYFISSGISVDTVSTNTAGYFTENIPNNDTAHIGHVSLGKNEYAVLVTNTSSSPVYNSFRIDLDQNSNFTDEVAGAVGDSIIIDSNNYDVGYIIETGLDITLRPNRSHEFRGVMEPYGSVYPESKSEKNIFVKSKTKKYNVTERNIDALVETATAACTAGEATMPPGEHLCGTFSAGVNYKFSITNASTIYDTINVDFNGDDIYNDDGEGPYKNGAHIVFGPETYRVVMDSNGALVSWRLYDRWSVPYGTVNYLGEGIAIWMPDNQVSDDEWSLFEAALVASGKSSFEFAKGAAHGVWAVSSSVFFANKETYMPYGVTLKMWY